jgi:uncharacterized membrane protein YphA (DoxX/SURF4 family)
MPNKQRSSLLLAGPGGGLLLLESVTLLIRFTLGGIFIWSSLSKLQQPYDFLHAVYDYELVGRKFGLGIAFAVPWLELVVGLFLVAGVLDRGAWLLTVSLLAIFTLARIAVLSKALRISCGCSGCASNENDPMNVSDLFIILLLLLAALVGMGLSLRLGFSRNSSGETIAPSPS